MVATAVAGGLLGAAVLFAAYFVGVAVVGAALGAVAAHLLFAAAERSPQLLAILFCAVIGAVAATYLQRYVLIVGTSFGGALTMIHGAVGLTGRGVQLPEWSRGVWVPIPLDPLPGQEWVPLAWVALALVGVGVQLGWTGGERGRVGRRKKKS